MATLHDLTTKKNGYKGKKHFQVAYTDEDGVRRRRNFERKEDAKRFQATMELQILKFKEGLLPDDYADRHTRSRLTVGEVFNLYQENVLDLKGKDSARGAVETQLASPVKEFRDVKVANLTVQMVNEWKVRMLKEGLASTTVRNYLTSFKGMFNWGTTEGHLWKSPIEKLKLPAKSAPKHEKDFLKPEEVRTLLSELRTCYPDLYDYFVFMINTGVRLGEAVFLEWDQVDMAERTVFIPSSKNKTNIDRKFRVNDAVMMVLQRLYREKAFDPYVFPRYSESRLADLFGNATEKILGVRVTSHVCRKTWATNLSRGRQVTSLEDGKKYWVKTPQHVIAKLGGWDPASKILLKIYQKVTEEDEKEAVELFNFGLDTETALNVTQSARIVDSQRN